MWQINSTTVEIEWVLEKDFYWFYENYLVIYVHESTYVFVRGDTQVLAKLMLLHAY